MVYNLHMLIFVTWLIVMEQFTEMEQMYQIATSALQRVHKTGCLAFLVEHSFSLSLVCGNSKL